MLLFSCFFLFREKKREIQREELWERLRLLAASQLHNIPPLGSTLISVDNNNKTRNNSIKSVTVATTAVAPITAQQQ